jgi:A/G-specific adenine glycosylase
MLQQTQVETVIPYYQRFLAVSRIWPWRQRIRMRCSDTGPGSATTAGRATCMRRRGKSSTQHGGHFPRDIDAILALPGIGRSTAAAITAFAFGERRAILDGNVKRVLTRVFGIDGWPGERAVENRLWALAEAFAAEY